MRIVQIILNVVVLFLLTFVIISISVRSSIDAETRNKIIEYSKKEYTIPTELESLKGTEEYAELESQLTNIQSFLQDSKTKATVGYIELINQPKLITTLLIVLVFLIFFECFVFTNIYDVIVNNSLFLFATGAFLLLAAQIFVTSQNEIVTSLISNFNRTGIKCLIAGSILMIGAILAKAALYQSPRQPKLN